MELPRRPAARSTQSMWRSSAPAWPAVQRPLLWRRTEAELDRIEELAGDAFRRTGSLRLAGDDEECDEIHSEFEALAEDGFAVEWRGELAPLLAPHFRAGM